MKRVILGMVMAAAACVVVALSCMDRQPGPVCPVPTEVSNNENRVQGFDGVDLLVVVDNSASMDAEQRILANGFFTLINSLNKPTKIWPWPAVENMRVAIVSTDLGLQYGDGETDGIQDNFCSNFGDDGKFKTAFPVTGINIMSGTIPCDASAEQCPAGFTCPKGFCTTTLDPPRVECPSGPLSGGNWVEATEKVPNANMATEVACLSALGTTGCGIEQQLMSPVRALSRDGQGIDAFLKDDHLLAVLIVSDEEDCSIKEAGLYSTDEWRSGSRYDPKNPNSGHLNSSCNFPVEHNDKYLYSSTDFYNQLIQFKNNVAGAVIFAAIVGVPYDKNSQCQGKGNEIGGCLDSKEMEYEELLYTNPKTKLQYYHFVPACQRNEGKTTVTLAMPGRRYVELAEKFQSNGYIYSICNSDWSPAMESIAEVIAAAIQPQCYPSELDWELVGNKGYGEAKCDMLVVVDSSPDADEYPECPKGLENVSQKSIETDSGIIKRVFCQIPKIATPKYCNQVKNVSDQDIGWYYCENTNQEDHNDACDDDQDNDQDGLMDCADDQCTECPICSGVAAGPSCKNTCNYSVEMTAKTKDLTTGYSVTIQCLQRFNFEDENCKENSNEVCNDDVDNDGNGIWDCTKGDNHFPDPSCCPLNVSGNNCSPASDYNELCPDVPVRDSDANTETVCEAAARVKGCSLTD